VPDALAIVDELNANAKFADYRIGSKDAHSPHAIWLATEDKPQLTPIHAEQVDVHWVAHAVPGTHGFELLAGLPKVTEYDFFVWKGVELDMHPYGCCYHDLTEKLTTGLIEFLQANKIDTVIIGGLATDYCVKITVLQLLKAGLQIIVNLGACRGIDPDTTQQAIKLMQQKGAVIINSAAELNQ
jgi:nicotinamidase/pyrazinamidase